MLTPSQLTATNFREYPPLARQVATEHVGLFREMPITFLALLLRELIAWDWKFPAERKELTRQFTFLNSVSEQRRATLFSPFARLQLSARLEAVDWVNSPATFSEQLSAHLWATHQIDSFHSAARDFFERWPRRSRKSSLPLTVSRLSAWAKVFRETVILFSAN